MSKNTLFSVLYGDYELQIDRTTFTYRLTEAKTGTVWADGLPVGWVEFEDRLTGGLSRYHFGQATLFSLSEKAGPQGKEILFGLECLGIPIDLDVTCGEKEIKLTVEANRDSRTHRVSEVCLLPGLCAVPDDGASCLVIPNQEGAIVRAPDAPEAARFLPVWQSAGLSMPFFGAVRGEGAGRSALALITDSAYGALRFGRTEGGGAVLDAHYARDPERRRLELRVYPLPGADHVGIARTYREKVINDRQHVLLRRKARDRPEVETLLGGTLVTFPIQAGERHRQAFTDTAEIARDLKNGRNIERAVCLFEDWTTDAADGPVDSLPAFVGAGGDSGLRQAADDMRALGYVVGAAWRAGLDIEDARRDLPELKRRYKVNALFLPEVTAALQEDPDRGRSRWDDMDQRMEMIALTQDLFPVFGSEDGGDWSAVACDFWRGLFADPDAPDRWAGWTARVPLYAAVYHDSVVAFPPFPLRPEAPRRFLRSLLALSPPHYRLDRSYLDPERRDRDYVRRTHAVLAPLHRLSFPAFLTAHRFLTPDCTVEEARYSNGARVLINSGDAPFEADDVSLPPLGFLAEHPRFVAHDALRVGRETFAGRVWRTTEAKDDKLLAQSADVERREFAL